MQRGVGWYYFFLPTIVHFISGEVNESFYRVYHVFPMPTSQSSGRLSTEKPIRACTAVGFRHKPDSICSCLSDGFAREFSFRYR